MLILGSTSARRKEILGFFRIPFEVCPSPFNEDDIPYAGNPEAYVRTLAEEKARSLDKELPILTADTIVVQNGSLFEKPHSYEEAIEMLLSFSGSSHTVFTAVCATSGEKNAIACAKTEVYFHNITEDQAKKYVHYFSVLDKAGGYAIQNGGAIIVKKIDGCFYNVMGLPLAETRDVLKAIGIDIWDSIDLSSPSS